MFSGSRLKLASNYKPLSSFNKNKAQRFLLSFSFHEQITSVTTIAEEGIRDHLIEFPANTQSLDRRQNSMNNTESQFTSIL